MIIMEDIKIIKVCDDLDVDDELIVVNKKNSRDKLEVDNKFSCDYCGKVMSSQQAVDYHMNAAVCFGHLHTCGRCLKPFSAEWKLARHQRSSRRCSNNDKVVVIKVGNSYSTISLTEYMKGSINETNNDDDI